MNRRDRSAAAARGPDGRIEPRPTGTLWAPYSVGEPVAATFRARQLHAVLRLAPMTMLANVLNVAIIVAMFWGVANPAFLIPWALVTTGIVLRGVLARWRMARRPARRTASRRAMRHATLHAALLSTLWAVTPLVLMPGADGPRQLLLIVIMAGMICAGGFALATTPVAGTVWVLILGVSATASLFFSNFSLAWYGAALLLTYSFIVIVSVWSTARMFGARLMAEAEAEHHTEVVGLLLRDFEENSSDALWEIDAEARLCRVSPRLAALFGAPVDRLTRAPLLEMLRNRAAGAGAGAGAGAPAEDIETVERHFGSGKPFRDLSLAMRVDDQPRWWSLTGKPLCDAEGRLTGWRGVAADVTESNRANRQLSWLAHFDPLTGVANRHQLRSHLAERLAASAAAGDGQAFALLALDLDHFKIINDTLGHAAGDALLRDVARRLRELTRPGDTVSRLGGDEFAIILRGVAGAPEAEALARRIVEGLALPCEVQGSRIVARASIGIALAPRDGSEIDTLLNHADLALYAAKAAGRGGFQTFTPHMAAVTRRRLRIEQALRGALGRGEMWIAFQPQVDLADGRVTGFEALLRWRHPELGDISPAEFIPVAEDAGEIQAIGAWVLAQACREAAGWPADLTVSVNVSPVQAMTQDVCAIALAALASSGLPASRLELEITESIFLNDSAATLASLFALRRAGMRIALDDFGTGYSSLAYLRRFPFATLKIDRAFVREIGERRDLRAIVRMIVGLARTLGMRTVAEGVETPSQANVLRRYGCDSIQGFMVARPMPAAAVAEFLDEWRCFPPALGQEPVQTGQLPLAESVQ